MRSRRIFSTIIALLVGIVFAVCIGFFLPMPKIYPSLKPLLDENGLYSEAAFEYNMALEKKNGIELFRGGKTDYVVRYSAKATEREILAAIDLLIALKEISGISFKASDDSVAPTEKEICVGKTNRGDIDDSLKADAGYHLLTKDGKIFLYGKTSFGASNAVYGFLEDYLGVMYMTAEETYYPSYSTAILPEINDRQDPDFLARDVLDMYSQSDDFLRRLKYSSREGYSSDGCHNSLRYVPLSEYYDTHPEYYAISESGKRWTGSTNLDGAQLCWSNPDVIALLKEGVLERIHQSEALWNTQETYWDMSQQDNINYCHCERCTELIERYQSGIAPILCAVNQVARELPQYKFSTLAYYYGSTPPVGLVPEKNVLIKYCVMSNLGSNDYAKPLCEATSKVGIKQYNELVGWSKLTENIYVWDYITNFFNYQLPFPCLDVLQKNYQLYRDCNVTGVLALSSYTDRGQGDAIKTYLAARLLWNPDCDFEFLENKFYTLYFGKAAPYIREMYEAQKANLKGILWVYDFSLSHSNDMLSEANVNSYQELLDKGFAAVKGEPIFEKRLRYEQISLLYTKISLRYDKENMSKNKRMLVEYCSEFGIIGLDEQKNNLVSSYIE